MEPEQLQRSLARIDQAKMNRRRVLRMSTAGMGLSALSLLSACGGKTTSSGGSVTTTTSAASSPAGAAGGSTLVFAVARDLQNLDPTSASSDGFTSEILTNIYRWVIDYKLTTGADGKPVFDANNFVGDLAESYEIQDGGKKVVFKIRQNLKFSSGDPIDANVVKFTYDRLFDQGTTASALVKLAEVNGKDAVKIVDDHTVEFLVDVPNTLLFGNIAQYGNSILNPKIVQAHATSADPAAHEWLKANTAGTESGPYLLESWKPGTEFVLAKNPHWHGDPPKTDRIIFRIVPDASTRLSLLKSGEVDIARDIAPKDLKDLANDPKITVYRFQSRIVSYIGMNATKPPFDNPKVRQAISYAIPYKTILDNVLYGYAIPLTSIVPQGMPTHTDEFFHYQTDPTKAKQILGEAGYPNGLKVTFDSPSDLAESKGIAIWLKSELRKAGIEVTINEMEGAAFTAGLQKNAHAFFHHPGWLSINNDPFYHLYWHLKAQCCDYTDYHNPEIQGLIDKYLISTDQDGRTNASRRIQEIAANDAIWGFLYQPDITLATRSNVNGVIFNPADRYWRFYYMYKA